MMCAGRTRENRANFKQKALSLDIRTNLPSAKTFHQRSGLSAELMPCFWNFSRHGQTGLTSFARSRIRVGESSDDPGILFFRMLHSAI